MLINSFICGEDLLLLSVDFAEQSSPHYIVLSILGLLATFLFFKKCLFIS